MQNTDDWNVSSAFGKMQHDTINESTYKYIAVKGDISNSVESETNDESRKGIPKLSVDGSQASCSQMNKFSSSNTNVHKQNSMPLPTNNTSPPYKLVIIYINILCY